MLKEPRVRRGNGCTSTKGAQCCLNPEQADGMAELVACCVAVATSSPREELKEKQDKLVMVAKVFFFGGG